MSENTPPPPNPYEPGQPPAPPAYGAPAYGAPTYGAPAYGAPTYGQAMQPPAGHYAGWGDRVVATIWDFIYVLPGLAVVVVGIVITAIGAQMDSGIVVTVGVLVALGGWVWMIWRFIRNYVLDQGRTGWTYGKRKVGIRLINEVDGTPVGAGMAFVRYLLHGLINQACYIDYLWPLWDDKKQTLTDKVLKSVVVQMPDPTQAR